MEHVRVVLGLTIPLFLAACSTGEPGVANGGTEAEQVTDDEAGDTFALSDSVVGATVGPVQYYYDTNALTKAEVLTKVPPGYGDEVWGAKLIPVSRTPLLGQDRCHYGQSGRTETCVAEKEAGLTISLLERPLAHYRQAFVDEGLDDELSPATFAGISGFGFGSEAEGSGTNYRFLALEDRTVLVARQFVTGSDESSEALRQVIRSISVGLDAPAS